MANVLPVFMYKPERVVLFTTPEEAHCADNLERLFKSYKITVHRKDNLDAYDYIKFKETVKQELDKQPDDVWLNVTGGTKLMALAAYEAFAEKDKNIFYCNTERNQIIHLYPKLETEKLTLNLSVEDYLNAYGYRILHSKSDELNPDYERLFKLLVQFNITYKFSEFLDKFRKEYTDKKQSKTFNDKKYSIFQIQKTPNGFVLFVNKEKFKFNDDKFLMGDWLEYLMFYFLKSKSISPMIGVKIISSGDVENEIDLVFIKDYQLYLISCKSGRATDPNKDIYEIETLRNIAGGTFGKAFLFTTQPLTKRIEQRAKELHIQSINLSNLNALTF
jgi:hypothetical protein